MTYIAHTQQPVDAQSLAQAELAQYMNQQAQAVAPTADPLTSRDRRIIAEIIESTPEQIKTIWLEAGITVWVQFVDGGLLPFDRDWFYTRVQQVKATLPETPRERNDRLSEELEASCHRYGLTHGEIDWLSFSTTLYLNGQRVGFVGYNLEGKWYSRQRPLGGNRIAIDIDVAIALLGIRQSVAA